MDYGSAPRATPLVHEDKVYVLSAFGELYCFDLKTGKTVWQLDFSKDFGVAEGAQVGLLQLAADCPGEADRQPRRHAALAALDPATGKVLWKGEGTGPTTPASSPAPSAASSRSSATTMTR